MQSLQLLRVARDFNRDQRTILRLVRKFQKTGSVDDLPRTPKRRVTTREQDQYVRLTHPRDRNLSARNTARTTIGKHGRLLSDQTIRNRLRAGGLRARRRGNAIMTFVLGNEVSLGWFCHGIGGNIITH